ncbi:sensor histidine kinase [Butyrivibrio sp. VCB2006]|uniref:sensor histidine kinase n=1 Tax=Butyrivibrio sp. VCB2006 TaxID=1280679 RepID=UPI00041E273B|nr:HAMP domain-containing sensor histidine kinase [Butyrivibrio sp. VCB2006]
MTEKKRFEQPSVDTDTVAELSKKLLEANVKLKEAENQRRMMLENISHDLRAPLTAIRSSIDCLKQMHDAGKFIQDSEEAEALQMLRLLDSRTKNLEVLIQDLYYLTRLENGSEDLELTDISIVQFLEEYFFSAEIDDRYKDRNMVLEISDSDEAKVKADVNKLSRVLDNLFTNAQKYSDKGDDIVLGANVRNNMFVFYVKDTGRGIPQDAIGHIFDRTYRVSEARTPSGEVSSGLGLSIAKNIIEQLGGNIYCESCVGEGSCFFVELPIIGE